MWGLRKEEKRGEERRCNEIDGYDDLEGRKGYMRDWHGMIAWRNTAAFNHLHLSPSYHACYTRWL